MSLFIDFLLFFSERMFCKAWREAFVVLYSDSSLVWFRDRDRNDSEGAISLKDAPEMLAAGQVRTCFTYLFVVSR
jgi:hypothetical protein